MMDSTVTEEQPPIPIPIELGPHNYMDLLLERFENFIFDLDGTVWRSDGLTPIDGFKQTYELLSTMGKNVFFITNGAHLTQQQLVDKIRKICGCRDIDREDVYSSGAMMAKYLKSKLKGLEKAYVLCDHGLKEELELAGVRFLGFGSDSSTFEPFETSEAEISSFRFDEDVKAVVCALDPYFNSTKIFKAASYLSNPSVEFLTTEISSGFSPYPKFQMWGTGSLVSAVAAAAPAAAQGRTPTVIGKPSHFLFDELCARKLGIDKEKTVIIGDSLASDVGFAKTNGIASCLVMTGWTSRQSLQRLLGEISQLNALREAQKGLKCFIGEEDDALPATVGPVPDFVVESAGHFGKWTPAGKWYKSVKKEKRKEERKMLKRGEDPSIPRNRLPYGDKGEGVEAGRKFSMAAFADPWQLYVLTGGPGSGKGTQGRLLAARYGFTHLSAGELLRSEIAWETERGKKFMQLLQAKGEIGIFEGLEMVRDFMVNAALGGARGFFVDGNPEDCDQGQFFEQMIGVASGVICLHITDGERMKRLIKRGKTSGEYRDDDTKKIIEKRLKKFHKKKGPVLKYFDDQGKLAYINGEGTMEEVHKALVRQMDKWILKDSKLIAATKFPGSGSLDEKANEKDFQLQKLQDKFAFHSFNSDELLAAEVAAGTPEGVAIKAAMDILAAVDQEEEEEEEDGGEAAGGGGGSVKTPEERAAERAEAAAWAAAELRRLLLPILRREMVSATLLTGVQGFLLQDCPQNLQEATNFEKEIRPIDLCVSITVKNQEEARERLAATPSGQDLLETFDMAVQPMTEYFRKRGKLIEVHVDDDGDDADDDADADADDMETKLAEREEERYQELFRRVGISLGLNAGADADSKLLADAEVVFVVGGPGSGKGTQCERLSDRFNLTHLSSGDLLREEVKAKTPLGLEMEEIMKQGRLVPMETVLILIKNAMIKAIKSGRRGFLIDGYPRQREQGIAFEKQIVPCQICLYFNAKDETMASRLLHRGETSGRSDDNQETIKLRLKTFHEETMPVISYYKDAGKLLEIDAENPAEEVFRQTLKGFEERKFGVGQRNFAGGHPAW